MPNRAGRQTESLREFLRGLIPVTNRFSIPKGATITLSNLTMNERGALQTVDGTVVTSVLPGGITQHILALGVFVNPATFATKITGLVEKNSTHLTLYNMSTNPATLLIDNIVRDTDWHSPQMFNFAGYMVITLGPGSPVQLYNEPGGTPTLTPISTTSFWQANRTYQTGDIIIPNPSNGYCYQVVDFNGVGGGLSGRGAGQSGAVQPSWPTPSGTDFESIHPTVADNTVAWRLLSKAEFAAGLVPPGGAHGISHEGAMWLFGTDVTENANAADGPMSIRQSHLNSAVEWPAIYAAFIGKDDGQVATGIASFTIAEAGIAPQGGLVLFKEFSTYNITGNFGLAVSSGGFSIQPVKTDLGCIAPRSVQFVPGYGIFRLSHMGIAMYNGVQDQLISEEIRPYIFGGFGITGINQTMAHHSRSALVSNPPMYAIAIPTGSNDWCDRLLCYDLILKAWTVVDLPFQISSFFQVRLPTQVEGSFSFPVTYMGGATDGKMRRWQAGDPSTWDTGGTSIAWSLLTPEIGGQPTGRLFFRRTTLRLHAPSAPSVTMTPIYGSVSGAAQTKTAIAINPVGFGPAQGGNQAQHTAATYETDTDYIVRFEQGVTGQSQRLSISGTGEVTLEAIDMEINPRPAVPLGQPV